jgi:hypothetical protein
MTARTSQRAIGRPDDGLFVLHARALRPGCELAATPRFGDDVWPLGAALLQQHEASATVDFGAFPQAYRQVTKELVYAMLSGPLPPGETRRSIQTIHAMGHHLGRFLRWLDQRGRAGHCGPPALAALTERDLRDYQQHLVSVVPDPGRRRAHRAFVRYFWRYRHALATDRLELDPRDVAGWSEGPHAPPAENTTARIPEHVLGPLIAWSLRFVDSFAADILAANDHWLRHRHDPPPGQGQNLRRDPHRPASPTQRAPRGAEAVAWQRF